jgi:glycosyltransferase involved in cell wall biosynthesis
MTMATERVLVIIPTYNERENLPGILADVRVISPEVDILVVDDNSPDGTGGLADAAAEDDDAISVLHRAGKQGLGAAYLAGFEWALSRGYDVIVEMDADGSHRPVDLPVLLAALADADVVLGSRWVPGGQVVNWPRSREYLSRGGNWYTRVALGLPLQDATGGFRVFRSHVLREVDLDSVASTGYCFQVDLAWRAVQRGFRVIEVPIVFVERTSGASKMSRAIVAEALLRVTQWGATKRWRQLRRRQPVGSPPSGA